MPHRFLMTLTLHQQGKIKGSTTSKSHAGSGVYRTPVLTVYTGPVLPWFASTGGSAKSGKTIVVTKQVDATSPVLWSSLATQGVIASVKFEIYGPGDGTSLGATIGKVGLTNVVIRNIRTLGHHVNTPPQAAGTVHQITFGFQTASLDLGASSAAWTREWTSGDT
jgi:type VI protein secretion system component Hcp